MLFAPWTDQSAGMDDPRCTAAAVVPVQSHGSGPATNGTSSYPTVEPAADTASLFATAMSDLEQARINKVR